MTKREMKEAMDSGCELEFAKGDRARLDMDHRCGPYVLRLPSGFEIRMTDAWDWSDCKIIPKCNSNSNLGEDIENTWTEWSPGDGKPNLPDGAKLDVILMNGERFCGEHSVHTANWERSSSIRAYRCHADQTDQTLQDPRLWRIAEAQKAQGVKPVVIRIDSNRWNGPWEFSLCNRDSHYQIADIVAYPNGTVAISNIRPLKPEVDKEIRVVCPPEPDSGWIEWNGSVTPPSVDDPVEVQFRDGTIQCGERARWIWRHSGEGDDIVRYRPLGSRPPRVDQGERWSDWIEWHGGEKSPIPDGVVFEYRLRNDKEFFGSSSLGYRWTHSNGALDIVAYRYRLDQMPRVDRSLRGWVHITDIDGYVSVLEARVDGVYERGSHCWTWDDLDELGWTVRKLTPEDIGFKVRYPGEWNATEEDELKSFCRGTYDIFSIADKAIDIATRGTHE